MRSLFCFQTMSTSVLTVTCWGRSCTQESHETCLNYILFAAHQWHGLAHSIHTRHRWGHEHEALLSNLFAVIVTNPTCISGDHVNRASTKLHTHVLMRTSCRIFQLLLHISNRFSLHAYKIGASLWLLRVFNMHAAGLMQFQPSLAKKTLV